ncbi:hypothetical protein CPB86DRAFT_251784 [Serendipita vermifera]|nr:hypothetical protein CPB86DRAFT_251784 [Serendipita vermifera]
MVTGCVGTKGCLAKRAKRRFIRLMAEKPESLRLLRRPESESHHLVGPSSGEAGSSSRSGQHPKCGEPARDADCRPNLRKKGFHNLLPVPWNATAAALRTAVTARKASQFLIMITNPACCESKDLIYLWSKTSEKSSLHHPAPYATRLTIETNRVSD